MKRIIAASLCLTLFVAGCTPPNAQAPVATLAPAAHSCNCSLTSIIFFDPGSAVLPAKDIPAIAQDASLYARQVPRPIVVTGGEDAAEVAANPALALLRAQAVSAQLQADGVAASNILLRDNGALHPMLPNATGAKAIMNRYVMTEIQVVPLPGAPMAPMAMGPYQMRSTVLYQPNAVLVARLGPDGARPLAAYIEKLSNSMAQIIAAAPVQPGVTAALVVGVKPGGAVRSWLVAPPGALPPALTSQIQAAVQTVPPMPVQNGPVAFAIMFNGWGGGAPITDPQHPVPMPREWLQGALQGAPGAEAVPDGVFASIWP